MKNHCITFAIGLAAGILGGLIGLGGGIIMIPLLVGLMKLDQCRAHGTSLAVLIFTGISGAATYGFHGQIDWMAAAALALPSLFTAAAGARLADRLPDWKLKKIFGVFLIVCSVLLLLKPFLTDMIGTLPGYAPIIALVITGIITGTVGAFTHWRLGNVAGSLLYGLVPGIIMGTFAGGNIAQIIPDNPLRWMFVLVTVYMGWRYINAVSSETCE